MARVRKTIEVPTTVDETFGYLAEFQHAADWDPGVAESEKLVDGPPGVGTRFRVVATFLGQRVPLVYEITKIDPPRRLVLEARTSNFASIDEISCQPCERGTRVSYDARLELEGLRRLADPALQLAFNAIGARAMAGLQEALEDRAAG